MKVKVYGISIWIQKFSEEEAMKELQRIAREITEEGTRACSAHPCRVEPYLPYIGYSCGENEQEVSSEWLDDYTEEEKKKMRIE